MRQHVAMPREPLGPLLRARAFRVAEALEQGVGAGCLRGADLAKPHHGVRIAGDMSPTAAHAYAPLLRPGERFSGSTALELWGAPLPSGERPLHVTASGGRTRTRRPGVAGHEEALPHVAAIRHGLPVSSAALAFLEAAAELSLDDLVAAGDYLVHDPRVLDPGDLRPHLTLAELRGSLAASRAPNVRTARRAADLVRPGAESRPETLLRLLLMRAGLPEPECGVAVADTRGRHIGWFDLVWQDPRVIAEYDGDQHRTSTQQYERDIRRFDLASDASYRVIRVRSHGLFRDPAYTVARVRAALDRPKQ